MLTWWYSGGISWLFGRIGRNFSGVVDFFSIDLLLKTLFSPFRQIDAGKTGRSLDAKLRAMLDGLISRFIGFIMRMLVMIFGVISLFVMVIGAIVLFVVWLVLPFMPIIGLTLFFAGWVPWPSL